MNIAYELADVRPPDAALIARVVEQFRAHGLTTHAG